MEAKLIMFRQNGERHDIPVRGSRTLIGREEGCDIRIPLPEVSRRHAELRVGPNEITVFDLGSANGTYVNNRRTRRARLGAGDHVVVGPVVFTVQIDGEPQAIRPVRTKLRRTAAISEGIAIGASAAALRASLDESDPITAVEALASDTTVIEPDLLDDSAA